MGELAIAGELQRAEIDVAARDSVGVTLVHQGPDQVNDLVHRLGRPGVNGGRADAKGLGVLEVLGDILLRDLAGGNTLLVGALDDLVVHVGEVLDKGDLIATVLQIAAQNVKEDDRAGVADVNQVVNGGAAGVHAHLARLDRDKFLLAAGH